MSLNITRITTTTSQLNSKNLSCFTTFGSKCNNCSFIHRPLLPPTVTWQLFIISKPTYCAYAARYYCSSTTQQPIGYTLSSRVIGQKTAGVLSLEYKYGQLLGFFSTALCLCFTNNINRVVDHNYQYLPTNRSP